MTQYGRGTAVNITKVTPSNSIKAINDNFRKIQVELEGHHNYLSPMAQAGKEANDRLQKAMGYLPPISQRDAVNTGKLYNGVSIDPTNGFMATRSDGLVQTTMNATEGITISTRASVADPFVKQFYVDDNGNLNSTGTITGATISGATITTSGTQGTITLENDMVQSYYQSVDPTYGTYTSISQLISGNLYMSYTDPVSGQYTATLAGNSLELVAPNPESHVNIDAKSITWTQGSDYTDIYTDFQNVWVDVMGSFTVMDSVNTVNMFKVDETEGANFWGQFVINPAGKIDFSSTSQGSLDVINSLDYTLLHISTQNDGTDSYITSGDPTYRLNIRSLSGNPGIQGDGTTIGGPGANIKFITNGDTVEIRGSGDGSYQSITASSFDVGSERALKKNIEDVGAVLPKLEKVNVKRYHYAEDNLKAKKHIGVIYDDLQANGIDDFLVLKNETGGISISDATMFTMAAVKELYSELKTKGVI